MTDANRGLYRRRRTAARRRRRAALFFALAAALTVITVKAATRPEREDAVSDGVSWEHQVPDAQSLGVEDEYSQMLREVMEKNPEAAEFVENYDGPKDPDPELTLDAQAGEIPYLTQWDSRWGYMVYGAGLMGWTGCGPTALSMVAIGLTGDGSLTPAYVAGLAVRDGYCASGDGTSWTLFSQGAAELGLISKELPLWQPTVDRELDAGRPVICIMGKGHFTDEGHYIVLTGHSGDGYSVLDPYRPSNCHDWPWADIESEIRNLWSYEKV